MTRTPLSVAVLAGGRSSERDVSLNSGLSVVAGLREAGHQPQLIEISSEGAWSLDGAPVVLSPGQGMEGFDIAFPVVHGPFGEDGTLQGLLESVRIPYVGSGVAASAIVLDKILAKQRLEQADVGLLVVDDKDAGFEHVGCGDFHVRFSLSAVAERCRATASAMSSVSMNSLTLMGLVR